MANFAIIQSDIAVNTDKIESGIVVNTIKANSIEDIEIAPYQECIEYDDSNPAIIGLRYENGVFQQQEPYIPEPEYDADGNFIGLKAVPIV